MNSGVEVQASYAARLGCTLAIGATLLVLSTVAFGTYFLSDSSANSPFPVPALVLPALALLFLFIPLLLVAEKRRIPRLIDPSGVTMRNGVKLPWSEYQGIRVLQQRTRSRNTLELGVELLFARGTALIRYRPIKNLPQ